MMSGDGVKDTDVTRADGSGNEGSPLFSRRSVLRGAVAGAVSLPLVKVGRAGPSGRLWAEAKRGVL